MPHELQNMIADKDELRWFFDHCVFPLEAWESYSMVLVSRHKKLTDEEKKETGLTRAEAEFLKTEVLRMPRFRSAYESTNITFDGFYKTVCRLNFDKEAYLTPKGGCLPSKTLAVLFYVNPADDIKVYDEVKSKVEAKRTGLIKAGVNGKKSVDYLQDLQTFGNLDSHIKHAKALCKGSAYWLDFDLDVPAWWKESYVEETKKALSEEFGKGNYVMVDTSGGYHMLVRTKAIKKNPKAFSERMEKLYAEAVAKGFPEYRNEKGDSKFECVMSGPGIPGIPLPGTYQYDRPVTVVNKEDFDAQGKE